VITAETGLQTFLELVGPGGTGKSTFLQLCSLLVGQDNCHATELKRLETNQYETASIYGKRLVLISDSSRYGGDVEILKQLTGGDALRGEQKYKGSFTFIPSCLVVLAANEYIQSTDSTSGLTRRRLTIRFDTRIPAESRDSRLLDKFRAELPGIMNWALGLSEAEARHLILSPCDDITSSKIEATLSSNPVASWASECIKPAQGHCVPVGRVTRTAGELDNTATMLYPSYANWCRQSGHRPVAVARFVSILTDYLITSGIPCKYDKKNAAVCGIDLVGL
jgi:putative DNA primase/helicase